MITKEIAEEMTPEEAAMVNSEWKIESLEVLHIITCKALLHLAAKDELEMYIDGEGKIFFRGRPVK